MRFRTKQDAVAAYEITSREANAYHHALVASMNHEIKRVGSVKDDGDTYVWHITFTPVYFAAIIIEDDERHIYACLLAHGLETAAAQRSSMGFALSRSADARAGQTWPLQTAASVPWV
jgi:hypothetical protein